VRGRVVGAYAGLGLVVLVVVTAGLLGRGLSRMHGELESAVSVAWATASRAIVALPETRRTREQVREIVRLFDGDRHVSAVLLETGDRVRARSMPARRDSPAPAWFERLVTPDLRPVRFELGGIGALAIAAEPGHLIDALWGDLFAAWIAVCAVVAAAAALAFGALDGPLRSARAVAAAADRIAEGDYGARAGTPGPRDGIGLPARFDVMATRLDEARIRSARLGAQMTAAQDEERAALARDLHDEVGPLLFAVDVDATAVGVLMDEPATDRRDALVRERARAIRDAAAAMKREVRDILGQLRPGVVLQIGLAQSLHDLAAFWKERHPSVAFSVRVPDAGFGPDVDVALNTVAREAVNNALKHGRPTRVDVEVAVRDGMIRLTVADDGGGFAADRGAGGYGIIGMRERIAALGGRLVVDQRVDVKGVTVSAAVPLAVVPGGAAASDGTEDAEP
jgi:two-component system sensor histidine kinase UhpB